MNKKLEEYKRKEKLLRSLERFESLIRWKRAFTKKKTTQKQVLDND